MPPIPAQEAARLEALRGYRVLDTAPEQAFDDITRLAAFICQSPIALMSLVDGERQWFKSKVGLETAETHRNISFCAHTIFQAKLLVVEDATTDDRFSSNPLVTGEPCIRFYAGAPLVTPEGYCLGALCVIDRQPRHLTVEQISALEAMSRLVVTQLELRRVSYELATAAANLRTVSGLLPICSYCKGIRNDQGYWQGVEAYIQSHTQAEFTHSICPQCIQQHFPQVDKPTEENRLGKAGCG